MIILYLMEVSMNDMLEDKEDKEDNYEEEDEKETNDIVLKLLYQEKK
jgi:hypothetical protein